VFVPVSQGLLQSDWSFVRQAVKYTAWLDSQVGAGLVGAEWWVLVWWMLWSVACWCGGCLLVLVGDDQRVLAWSALVWWVLVWWLNRWWVLVWWVLRDAGGWSGCLVGAGMKSGC
jgi:TRAP-type mannitol/chloroaromatic compound transport system permease large subunit